MNRAMNLADWGLLLATAMLLGSTFLFLNIAIKEISPLTSAALRTLIAAPICWGLMRAFGARLPSIRHGIPPAKHTRSRSQPRAMPCSGDGQAAALMADTARSTPIHHPSNRLRSASLVAHTGGE